MDVTLRQFFLSLPREIEEAFLIGGANGFQVFTRTVPPLVLYLFAQRYIIEGVSRSGLKG